MKQVTRISSLIIAAADKPFESFIQTDMALGERLKVAEAEAAKQAKAAEEAWQNSRKQTDSLLAKVHAQMAALNSDLDKSAQKQKEDLALLETSRQKESDALRATEKKLQDLQKHTPKVQTPVVSSFIDEDYLAPLRKAAEAAKAFAEKIRAQTADASRGSLLQEGQGSEDFASKAEHSLSLAQQALSKLDSDLAAQKRDLEVETAKAKQDEEALRSATHMSFLQTGESFDPLSPKALAEWREKFQAELERARLAAGINTPFKSSFAQLDTSTDEKLKEDERNVARLQEAYDNQMAKLKQDNAALMAQARAEIDKAKEMKSKLEADMRASSFMETKHTFDVNAEQEKIKKLQAKWEKEAMTLGEPLEKSKELRAMIDHESARQATANAEIERLQHKLNDDLEVMQKDMVVNKGATVPSFIQESAKDAKKTQDLMEHAKELIMKLGRLSKGEVPTEDARLSF